MIEVKFDNANVLQALERLAKAATNPRPVLLSIGEDLVKSTKNRFNESRGPDGKAWAPNSPATLKRKPGSKPLIGEDTLRDQIGYAEGGNVLSVFSTMEYSAMQQFGGKKSKFPHLWGDIPARPFLGISDADEQMIVKTVSDYLRSMVS